MCAAGTTNFIHASAPVLPGDTVYASGLYTFSKAGWFANCYSLPGELEFPAIAYAICLKKQ